MTTPSHADLVKVFDCEQESEARVVHGLLQSAGIESQIASLDFPQDVIPVGGMVIRVCADQADEARRLIAEFQQHPLKDSEAEAAIVSDDPPVLP